MIFIKRKNEKGDKINFYYDYGRGRGQRPATGVFIYSKPRTQVERNHNKEALQILEIKKSQVTIQSQAIGTGYIPTHRFKKNFLEYYQEYIDLNRREINRALPCSLNHFKSFVGSDFLAPIEITENLCRRFRQYLLDRLSGETPANYYARFKWVVKAATKDGYFLQNPTGDVKAKGNPSKNFKEFLEIDEYLELMKTPCFNEEVREGFIFCLYTGLRFVDANALDWGHIRGNALVTRIIQAKTGLPVTLTLHPIAKAILEKRRNNRESINPKEKIFYFPTHDGSNKVLSKWVYDAGIDKYVTWSCARLSFSILLKDKNTDDATIAYLMGHSTTKQVL